MPNDSTSRARSILDGQATQRMVIEALRNGMPLSSAANIVGITRSALHNYRRANPDFHVACMKAIAECEQAKLASVNESCLDDGKLALEFLARRFPTRWSPRQEVRQFGADDEDDRDDHEHLSDEELERAAR